MKKLAPLLVLYFSQGLPFGFQATALPLLLRERGASLQAIGFASLLSAPWLTKAFWAPLVDRFGNDRFGRRKSWIVPMQAALMLCAVCAARTDDMRALAGLVLAMNFFAATQDIAVDALAVSWLEARDLGPANAIQVVGYKLGMLTGGGLLVWASARIGWSGLWNAMAALMFGVLLMSVVMRERPAVAGSGSAGAAATGVSFAEIGARLRAAFRHRATAALLAVVSTYKMGEVMADVMWKPMLFDRGFSAPQIGLWNGTFGMLFSLAGSGAIGLLLRRVALSSALFWTAVARAAGVALLLWLSLMPQPSAPAVIAVTCVEHLAGGAITTVLFTLMMRHTDRQIGATHYTLLASMEVWGKLPLAAVSGVIAARIGYSGLFTVASGLCIAFVLLTAALRARLAA